MVCSRAFSKPHYYNCVDNGINTMLQGCHPNQLQSKTEQTKLYLRKNDDEKSYPNVQLSTFVVAE